MLLPSAFNDNLFNDFFYGFTGRPGRTAAKRPAEIMKTDVKENETGYEVIVDLPGYNKEDVKVSLKDGYLTIEAQTSSETEENNKESGYIRRERFSGSCSRAFYIGEETKEENINARFENGTLILDIAKVEPQPAIDETRYIAIA